MEAKLKGLIKQVYDKYPETKPKITKEDFKEEVWNFLIGNDVVEIKTTKEKDHIIGSFIWRLFDIMQSMVIDAGIRTILISDFKLLPRSTQHTSYKLTYDLLAENLINHIFKPNKDSKVIDACCNELYHRITFLQCMELIALLYENEFIEIYKSSKHKAFYLQDIFVAHIINNRYYETNQEVYKIISDFVEKYIDPYFLFKADTIVPSIMLNFNKGIGKYGYNSYNIFDDDWCFFSFKLDKYHYADNITFTDPIGYHILSAQRKTVKKFGNM